VFTVLQEKEPLYRPRIRWNNNNNKNKIYATKYNEDVDRIDLAQHKEKWRVVTNAPWGSIKFWLLLD
jgi:hypothetical protein